MHCPRVGMRARLQQDSRHVDRRDRPALLRRAQGECLGETLPCVQPRHALHMWQLGHARRRCVSGKGRPGTALAATGHRRGGCHLCAQLRVKVAAQQPVRQLAEGVLVDDRADLRLLADDPRNARLFNVNLGLGLGLG